MNIYCILHEPNQTVGIIEDWAFENNYSLSYFCPYNGEILPPIDNYDFLIVTGGSQSPLEMDKYPYLRDEINFIKSAIKQNKCILGICLGAQLLAESLGAKTLRSPQKETGIFPVKLTQKGLKNPIFEGFPKSLDVIHWHNDMPSIPKNANLLASSKGCPNQAFSYGKRAYGFQFHMEVKPSHLITMVELSKDELGKNEYIQTAEKILGADIKTINNRLKLILDRIIAG